MSDQYWVETKDLFSKIITSPPLTEKNLKRPPPKYLFFLVINTMNKTGFPKGLFTPEEETIEYFTAESSHKKEFFEKVIDITKIITKRKINIDINNILKGLETEKTNKFLQYFYEASTTNINYKPLIEKYLNDIKNNNSLNESKKDIDLKQKQEIISGKKIKENGYIFWIDKDVHNSENSGYLANFQQSPQYKKLNLKLICFENLEEAFDLIVNYINFKLLFIIISGSLYPYYYYTLNNHIKYIKCLPICIIFTSNETKEILLKRSNKYNLETEVFDSINNSFYNLGGVSSDFNSCINFIFNFYQILQTKFEIDQIQKNTYDGCITFECVISKNQLILPFLYNELMEEKMVNDNEIQIFKNFMLMNHRED